MDGEVGGNGGARGRRRVGKVLIPDTQAPTLARASRCGVPRPLDHTHGQELMLSQEIRRRSVASHAEFNQLRSLQQLRREQLCGAGNPGRSAVVGNSRLSLAATWLRALISSADS